MRLVAMALLAALTLNGSCRAATARELVAMGAGLAREGRYEEALVIWERVLGEDGGQLDDAARARVMLSAARANLKLGRRAAAGAWCDRVLVRRPDDPQALRLLEAARPKLLPERVREALARLEDGLVMERTAPRRARAALRSAEPVFREALAAGVETGRASFGLGACLLRSGSDLAGAEQALLRAQTLEPARPDVLRELAALCQRKGDLDREVGYLEQLRDTGQAGPSGLAALARALGRRNAPGDAERVVRLAAQALEGDPSQGLGLSEGIVDPTVQERVARMADEARRREDDRRREEERLLEESRSAEAARRSAAASGTTTAAGGKGKGRKPKKAVEDPRPPDAGDGSGPSEATTGADVTPPTTSVDVTASTSAEAGVDDADVTQPTTEPVSAGDAPSTTGE